MRPRRLAAQRRTRAGAPASRRPFACTRRASPSARSLGSSEPTAKRFGDGCGPETFRPGASRGGAAWSMRTPITWSGGGGWGGATPGAPGAGGGGGGVSGGRGGGGGRRRGGPPVARVGGCGLLGRLHHRQGLGRTTAQG